MVAATQAESIKKLADYPIALIVARSRNYTIGCSNELPWRQQDDLKRFKRATLGKPVIIGRRTYESIGSPLVGRLSIVLTRNPDFADEINSSKKSNVVAVTSIAEAISRAVEYLDTATLLEDGKEIIVAGGQEIFEAFIAASSKIYLTVVEAEIDGDASFPREETFPLLTARQVGRFPADESNEHDCTYYEYFREKCGELSATRVGSEADTNLFSS